MFAHGVVVAVNVGKNRRSGVPFVTQPVFFDHFGFQGSHKRFSPSIVIGVGPSGHALGDAGIPKEFPERLAAILTAAVAVKDELLIPGTRSQCLPEGLIHKVGAKMIRQVPADHPA